LQLLQWRTGEQDQGGGATRGVAPPQQSGGRESERDQDAEHVIVAGRGLVPLHDDLVDIYGARAVDAAADALAGAAAGTGCAAAGLVGGDVGVADGGGRGAGPVEEAAAEAVAAVAACAPGAAGGLVGTDGAVAQRQAGLGPGEAVDAAV